MRIDKYLKISRIIKRRTEAKKACDCNSIKLNGKTAKAGDSVRVSDRIEIRFRSKILEIEVLEIPEGNVSISHSSQLCKIIKEDILSLEE